jgi:hypothetical protein
MLRILAAVAFFLPCVNAAHAIVPIVLPGALSYEYFGLNFAVNIDTSNSVGVLNYGGHPGCGGVCTATTALGSIPTAAVNVNEVAFDTAGGGYAEAELAYYVEYLNAPGTYTVDLHTTDHLSVSGSLANAQAYLGFGPAGSDPTSFNNFSSIAYQDTDCAVACSTGVANYTSPAPLPGTESVQMIEGKPYELQIWVTINPGTTGTPLSASVDPYFTSTVPGGTFVFSPGVTNFAPAVPEPATWILTLIGFAAFAAFYRRRINPAAEASPPDRAKALALWLGSVARR